jgi:hypothetical protein
MLRVNVNGRWRRENNSSFSFLLHRVVSPNGIKMSSYTVTPITHGSTRIYIGCFLNYFMRNLLMELVVLHLPCSNKKKIIRRKRKEKKNLSSTNISSKRPYRFIITERKKTSRFFFFSRYFPLFFRATKEKRGWQQNNNNNKLPPPSSCSHI